MFGKKITNIVGVNFMYVVFVVENLEIGSSFPIMLGKCYSIMSVDQWHASMVSNLAVWGIICL